MPLSYYVDNHSIFRFIERRDSFRYKNQATEETAVVQWKEVMDQLQIEITYALSPAAKGKVERPYRWLQDHLVRTCLHERIDSIEESRKVLYEEIYQYNFTRIHSVTKDIPVERYERALGEKLSLFRPLRVMSPYQKLEDIFCYRVKRKVNSYRRVSFNKLTFSVSGASIHAEVELRVSFDADMQRAKVRIWYQDRLVGEQQIKIDDLNKVHF